MNGSAGLEEVARLLDTASADLAAARHRGVSDATTRLRRLAGEVRLAAHLAHRLRSPSQPGIARSHEDARRTKCTSPDSL